MYLLRIPLSETKINSCLAASYALFMLFIFGLTPTVLPPTNK